MMRRSGTALSPAIQNDCPPLAGRPPEAMRPHPKKGYSLGQGSGRDGPIPRKNKRLLPPQVGRPSEGALARAPQNGYGSVRGFWLGTGFWWKQTLVVRTVLSPPARKKATSPPHTACAPQRGGWPPPPKKTWYGLGAASGDGTAAPPIYFESDRAAPSKTENSWYTQHAMTRLDDKQTTNSHHVASHSISMAIASSAMLAQRIRNAWRWSCVVLGISTPLKPTMEMSTAPHIVVLVPSPPPPATAMHRCPAAAAADRRALPCQARRCRVTGRPAGQPTLSGLNTSANLFIVSNSTTLN